MWSSRQDSRFEAPKSITLYSPRTCRSKTTAANTKLMSDRSWDIACRWYSKFYLRASNNMVLCLKPNWRRSDVASEDGLLRTVPHPNRLTYIASASPKSAGAGGMYPNRALADIHTSFQDGQWKDRELRGCIQSTSNALLRASRDESIGCSA